jgi:hypothetical protein
MDFQNPALRNILGIFENLLKNQGISMFRLKIWIKKDKKHNDTLYFVQILANMEVKQRNY